MYYCFSKVDFWKVLERADRGKSRRVVRRRGITGMLSLNTISTCLAVIKCEGQSQTGKVEVKHPPGYHGACCLTAPFFPFLVSAGHLSPVVIS